MGVSLELNGRTLTASDEDAIPTFWSLAAGEMDRYTLAARVRANSVAT